MSDEAREAHMRKAAVAALEAVAGAGSIKGRMKAKGIRLGRCECPSCKEPVPACADGWAAQAAPVVTPRMEWEHDRDCLYVTSEGPAACTCGAGSMTWCLSEGWWPPDEFDLRAALEAALREPGE